MAASDNAAAAAADLRRLASINEADLEEALAYMGREPFRRLRRAVGRTATPLPSDDEGGSGPARAQGSSSPFRLDPAGNVANQVTASSEANVNNLDPALGTDSFLAAVSSPAASMATQDPVWPPSVGGTTALEDYLAEQAALFPHRRLRLDPPLCQPRRLLPWLRTTPSRAWHRPSRAKRQRARGRPLRARIQTQCCPPPRGQSRRSANWRTKLVGRQSLLCRACRGSSPLAQPKSGPPKKRRIPRSCPTASRPPPVLAHCRATSRPRLRT